MSFHISKECVIDALENKLRVHIHYKDVEYAFQSPTPHGIYCCEAVGEKGNALNFLGKTFTTREFIDECLNDETITTEIYVFPYRKWTILSSEELEEELAHLENTMKIGLKKKSVEKFRRPIISYPNSLSWGLQRRMMR